MESTQSTFPSASIPSVCVLIPVGPSEVEIPRLIDLIDAVRLYEPAVTTVVFLDDTHPDRGLDRRLRTFASPVRLLSLPHPRKGQGNGLWGGLTQGVLAALGFICANTTEPIILRLDTDAHVLAPFAHRLAARFARSPDVGILGTVARHCDGSPRSFDPWHNYIPHLAHRWGRCRGNESGNLPRRCFQTLLGPARIARNRISAALAAGYHPGEHALGGAYAISRTLLNHFSRHNLFTDAPVWRPFFVSEDVVVSMYCRLVGLRLADFNQPGEVFGVEYRGLPDTIPALADAGYALIHSLKNNPLPEADLRDQLRARRDRARHTHRPTAGLQAS